MYLKDGRSFLYVGDVGRKLVINIPNLNIIRVCYETKEGSTKDVDLNAYKNTLEAEYERYKDIKYYDNKIKIEKNTITSTRTIDYSKIDTDKLLSAGSEYYELITDGKVKLSALKDLYTKIGMTCKKK